MAKREIVVVIKNNLKYRIPGFKKGEGFTPKIGDKIPLSGNIVKIEMNTGNVRKLFPEELEMLKAKRKARQSKKAKNK